MNNKLRSILLGWLVHTMIILAAVNFVAVWRYIDDGLPDTRIDPWESFIFHTFYRTDTLRIVIALFLVELSYQFLFKKIRLLLFVLSCFITGVLAFFILYQHRGDGGSRILLGPVLYFSAYVLLYAFARNYLYMFRHKTVLLLERSKNELDALKAQINPHFLFNSLNYLYGTALRENASATADGIDQLSEMMRYTITGIHENLVPVEWELKFIERYLDLQKARLPQKDSIRVHTELPLALPDKKIAPLLLLPFIENAFKYGISNERSCFVELKIQADEKYLRMEISNSIIPGPAEVKGNNTGIKNAVRRLKLIYGGQFKLQQANNTNEYEVKLSIPLTTK